MKLNLNSQLKALDFVGSKIKLGQRAYGAVRKSTSQEAQSTLANVVLANVSVDQVDGVYDFKAKVVYICCMMRRVLTAGMKGGITDDRDFVGNKRIESSGNSSLFIIVAHCTIYLHL